MASFEDILFYIFQGK